MNYNTIFNITGKVIRFEAALLLIPLAVALWYREDPMPFLIAILIALILGTSLVKFFKDKNDTILMRDGFVIVSLAWIGLSIIGAFPFMIGGEIPNFCDAFFETVSGFTTTGASILTDVEAMSKGLLFWRSLTHWIGGVGILVFIMAISIRTPGRSSNILRAEMAGHSLDKLVPKTGHTAGIICLIYLGMTVIEAVLLIFGNMGVYDSIVHSLGTAGTGGFGIKADSIGSYSPYLQWVIAIFMLLFGVNFKYYYLILFGQGRELKKSNELKWYLIIAFAATVTISFVINSGYSSYSESLRHSAFQVSSVMTTTGFSTVDFNLWPNLAKSILFILMFIGGCIGSTAGGIKVSRIVILGQELKNHMKKVINPRSVRTITLNGKILDESVAYKISVYMLLYITVLFGAFLVISFEPHSFETNFTAVVACMNNIGPGFGDVGPAASFSMYTGFSKIVLSIVMLLGRLEIYPILVLFTLVKKGRNS